MRSKSLSTRRILISLACFVAGALSLGPFACTNTGQSSDPLPDAGDSVSDSAVNEDAAVDAEEPDWACTFQHNRKNPPNFDGVPKGWVQPPCTPSHCPLVMAPDLSLTGPPLEWVDCGPGCLEYGKEPANSDIGIYAEVKARIRDGKRYLAYSRSLRREPGGPGTHMVGEQILRLPDNTVTFDMLWLKGLNNDGCTFYVEALGSDKALMMANLPTDDFKKNHRLIFTTPLDGGPLTPVLERKDEQPSGIWATSSSLWTVSFGYASFEWHDMSPRSELRRAWTSPDGSSLSDNMRIVGSNVFFSTIKSGLFYQVLTFNPDEGISLLAGPEEMTDGHGACWLDTDGKDMAWRESKGWDPDKEKFAGQYLMISKFATSTSELRPRVLRANAQSCQGTVGGGYVLTLEGGLSHLKRHMFLTRIEDGAFWEIEPPDGFSWGKALYVDEEELGALKYRVDGDQLKNYSIVRQSIAALGPPRPVSSD